MLSKVSLTFHLIKGKGEGSHYANSKLQCSQKQKQIFSARVFLKQIILYKYI